MPERAAGRRMGLVKAERSSGLLKRRLTLREGIARGESSAPEGQGTLSSTQVRPGLFCTRDKSRHAEGTVGANEAGRFLQGGIGRAP